MTLARMRAGGVHPLAARTGNIGLVRAAMIRTALPTLADWAPRHPGLLSALEVRDATRHPAWVTAEMAIANL